MKPTVRLIALAGAALLLLAGPLHAAKIASDLAPPEKRRVTVEIAVRLTRPIEIAPTPADLASPFNPPNFDQPDPEELRAQLAKGLGAGGPGGPGGPGGAPVAVAAPPPPGEHEILEQLAAKLPSTGTIIFQGEPLLLLGRNRVKIGDKFTVGYNGQDYELELNAIDRTTFTLRYHGEEITRPIKLGKSP